MAAVGLTKLRSLWYAQESAFSTDPSGDGSGYAWVRALNLSVQTEQEYIERQGQFSTMSKRTGKIGGKGGQLIFATELRGTGTAAISAVASPAGEVGNLLEAALGAAKDLDTGSTVVSATSSSVTVTAGKGSNWTVGSAILCAADSSTSGQVRYVTAIATDTLTVDRAWTTTPSAGWVACAGSNYKPADTGHKTVSFYGYIGGANGYYILMTGCAGNFVIENAGVGGVPQLKWTFAIDTWTMYAADQKAGKPAETDSYPAPPVMIGSPLYIGATATDISDMTFDAGIQFSPQPATGGTNGRSDYRVTDRDHKGSFKPYYALAFFTDFATDDTTKDLLVQFGGVPGKTVALRIPSATYTAIPNHEDVESQMALNIQFRATYNATADFMLAFL